MTVWECVVTVRECVVTMRECVVTMRECVVTMREFVVTVWECVVTMRLCVAAIWPAYLFSPIKSQLYKGRESVQVDHGSTDQLLDVRATNIWVCNKPPIGANVFPFNNIDLLLNVIIKIRHAQLLL